MPKTRLQVQALQNHSSSQEEEVRLASQCQNLSDEQSEGHTGLPETVAEDQTRSSSQKAAFLLGSGFVFGSASARTHSLKPQHASEVGGIVSRDEHHGARHDLGFVAIGLTTSPAAF